MKPRHAFITGIHLSITLGCIFIASCQLPKRLNGEKEMLELASIYSASVKFENDTAPRRMDLTSYAVAFNGEPFWDAFHTLERKIGRERAIKALHDIVEQNGVSMLVARPLIKANLGEADFARLFASRPATTLLYKQIKQLKAANPGNPGAGPAIEIVD